MEAAEKEKKQDKGAREGTPFGLRLRVCRTINTSLKEVRALGLIKRAKMKRK